MEFPVPASACSRGTTKAARIGSERELVPYDGSTDVPTQ